MPIGFLLERFLEHGQEQALVWKGGAYSYALLRSRIEHWRDRLTEESVEPGTVTILNADFSPNSAALFLALAERRCIVVPLTLSVRERKPLLVGIARAQLEITLGEDDTATVATLPHGGLHPRYEVLRAKDNPGLVIFTSGSTGQPKGAVHDLRHLLEKFHVARRRLRTLSFLLYDHIGGVNTLLHTLSCGGCLVTVAERSPDTVLAAVHQHKVEVLPVSPSFLNLVLLSGAHERHDLSSLETVSYGTEPMPRSTLERFHRLFPKVRLLQMYGMSEVGILHSRSKSSNSPWIKLGGDEMRTRVVEGLLELKGRGVMVGYLNAEDPLTEDGWLRTGDAVEVDGEYMRILGRQSDLINVGGEKVFPAEVEDTLMSLPGVAGAVVFGEPNPILGAIVHAYVEPNQPPEDPRSFAATLKRGCRERLEPFKIPVKLTLVDALELSARFKRSRPGSWPSEDAT